MKERKQAFADYYIEFQNATKAAEMAGYSTPRNKGPLLLKDEEVREYIEMRLSQIRCKRIATGDDILKYLSGCVLGIERETKFFVTRSSTNGISGGYDDTIEEREVVVNHTVRVKAAENLAKIYKLIENFNCNNDNRVTIINDIPRKLLEDEGGEDE